jgi:hypothetical protein
MVKGAWYHGLELLCCLRVWTASYHRWKNELPSLSRHFAGECKAVRQLKLNRSWVMQQNNDPKHPCKSTTEWLQQKKYMLSGVAQSE